MKKRLEGRRRELAKRMLKETFVMLEVDRHVKRTVNAMERDGLVKVVWYREEARCLIQLTREGQKLASRMKAGRGRKRKDTEDFGFKRSIRFDDVLWEEIREESEMDGIDMSEWIRQACREKLDAIR